MERAARTVKPFVYGAVIFITLGITIANETLSRVGLQGNYIYIAAMGLLLAAILLGRGIGILSMVVVGIIALNLPDATLAQLYLDRDVLSAAVCAMILVPSVYELVSK